MAGSVIIQGQLTGIPPGNLFIGPYTIVPNGSNNYTERADTLASGPNTIPVPSWASAMIILPSTSNTVELTLKGAAGDTGIPLGLIQPTLINFDVAPANIIITAASLFTTLTSFIFF